MDTRDRALEELKWMAYLAQQLGWTSLAERIASDAMATTATSRKLLIANVQAASVTADGSSCKLALGESYCFCDKEQEEDVVEKDEDDDSSFDRLNNLDTHWRKVSKDLALLHETNPDEFWSNVTNTHKESPHKAS
jgi:hypothetical protein